jgi:hypothetical protein
MWKGSSRSLFKTLVLENFKFILFVTTPIVTASLFWNDTFVERIVRNRQYVNFPPEGERPPANQQELEEIMRERAARRARAER